MQLTRRQLLAQAGAVSAAFLTLRALDDWLVPSVYDLSSLGLVHDPAGLLDLPPGFSYAVFSRTGETMSDGLLVPAAHDGMGAFPAPGGRILLVRNHEAATDPMHEAAWPQGADPLAWIPRDRIYDPGGGLNPGRGGTTTLLYDPRQRRLERHFLSLAGTYRNCSGGIMPWGSWISCEEAVERAGMLGAERDHGYAFEIPARADTGLVEPVPLLAMGRFRREGVAIGPASPCLYQTEDRADGLFYRFVPDRPIELRRGGRLQALRLRDRAGADTRNWNDPVQIPANEPLAVEWVDLAEVTAPRDDLRLRGQQLHGAAVFSRSEGIWPGADGIYFCATNGGRIYQGQLWRYRPSPFEGQPREAQAPGTLELFYESKDETILQNPDNVCVAPWGELFVCEDGPATNFLLRVSADGVVRAFALVTRDGGDPAGAVFSPDGRTLFLNRQQLGATFAITGPWEDLDGLRL